jgi:ribosomal protein L40E
MTCYNSWRYSRHKFCSKCGVWLPRDAVICPECGSKRLRSAPKLSKHRRKYNNRGQYNAKDARQIYKRFLDRGYSPDEAHEIAFILTGIEITPREVETIVPVQVKKILSKVKNR